MNFGVRFLEGRDFSEFIKKGKFVTKIFFSNNVVEALKISEK